MPRAEPSVKMASESEGGERTISLMAAEEEILRTLPLGSVSRQHSTNLFTAVLALGGPAKVIKKSVRWCQTAKLKLMIVLERLGCLWALKLSRRLSSV